MGFFDFFKRKKKEDITDTIEQREEALVAEAISKEQEEKEAREREIEGIVRAEAAAMEAEMFPEESTSEESLVKPSEDKGILQKEDLAKESLSKEGLQKEDLPKKDLQKEDVPKEDFPKKDLQKEDVQNEDFQKETSQKETSQKETSKEEITVEESKEKQAIAQEVLAEEKTSDVFAARDFDLERDAIEVDTQPVVQEPIIIEETHSDKEPASGEESTETIEEPVKKGFFRKLMEGLTKTRDHVMDSVNQVLNSFSSIDEEFYEELEEALIIGDLGVNTAIKIVAGLKEKVKAQKIKDPKEVKNLLKAELKEQMHTSGDAYDFVNKKSVVLVIGVNGVGKTTTIGKLASQYKKSGKKVMLAAADTFRAAAIDQLKEWASRSDVPIIAQGENSDPGAVVFDAIASAKSKEVDILICDTAGRLHNKKNLMAELGKIYRIIGREYPEAHLEVLLVLDSTTGQNALVQAKEFKEMANITGIVLTKLDGTSKGGIAVAISADLKLPVKYIGIGEGIEDLRPFDSNTFVDALFGEADVKESQV